MRTKLPAGTVTFLFTDVEGSTKLLHDVGPETYAEWLEEHRRVLREAFHAQGGVEVDTQGDAFFFAFPTAPAALAAAAAGRRALAQGPIRVRMGIHTGTPHLTDDGYVGVDVHRAARIAACGHGGQVLVSASTAALAGLERLRDLGLHRLKDLSAPERIYQLGDEPFSPLKSLYQTNLPVPSTPFLGRERELAEVLGLLGRDDIRLLTLTGPGGTGKTRLAAQAAGLAADDYPQGVWWVPLAPLRDPELVLASVAQVVGAKNGLAEHIADKAMLLLLDNFEHVVDAAGELAALLVSCPALGVLVTSRERLRLAAEQEYPVPPLVRQEAVGFLLARARAVKPDLEVDEAVPEICRRLDDLPLALELAAARVRVLSPAQILERLERRLPLLTGGARDLPERQRTLRATIEWSYELLTEDEQRLFARLAVFRGGCTLEAAEQVSDAELDVLESLVDKSLVRHTDEHFWMLETIREYALERLEERGEGEEVRRRHADYFLAVAEAADADYRGGPKDWLDALEREHDNFRAAFDRLDGAGETQLALRLAAALWRFLSLRGHVAEGRRRLAQALANDKRPTAARANALCGAAALEMDYGGDTALARRRAKAALTLSRKLGYAWGVANASFLYGHTCAAVRDFATAQPLWEESVRLFRELDDEHYTLLAMQVLSWAYDELGENERAQALDEETLARARATSNRRMEAMALDALATRAREEGRHEQALAMLTESLAIYLDLELPGYVADSLSRFAAVLARAGRGDTATQLLSRSAALYEEVGASAPSYVAARNEETIALIRSALEEAAFADTWEQGSRLTVEAAIDLALGSLG